MKLFCSLLLITLFPFTVFSATVSVGGNSGPGDLTLAGRQAASNVPGQFSTIQGAIDIVADGDTILVDSGTYAENIDFKLKSIVLKSKSGPSETTIRGSGNPYVITGSNSGQIEGFTITSETSGEAGILALGEFRITRNIIRGLAADGIVCLDMCHSVIGSNIIYDNSGNGISGALQPNGPVITDNIIVNNTGYGLKDNDGTGGIPNLIAFNDIWNNAGSLSGINTENLYANISADPLFSDAANNDFTLQPGSPCIDRGNPEYDSVDGSGVIFAKKDIGPYTGSWGSAEYIVSTTAPHKSFHIVNRAVYYTAPGDTVYLDYGVCYENVRLKDGVHLIGKGIDESYIDIYDGQSWYILQEKGCSLSMGSNNYVSGITINGNGNGSGFHGVFVRSGGGGAELTGCKVNSLYGISVYYSSARISGNTLYGNIYCDNSGDVYIGENVIDGKNQPSWNEEGIICSGASTRIVNNIITNYKYGIIGAGSDTPFVVNNTFADNATAINATSNFTIRNNIFAHNTQYGIYCSSAPTIEYNDFWMNTFNFSGSALPFMIGQITKTNANGTVSDPYSNIFENPLFVDYDSDNFLIAKGSPLVNAGKMEATLPLDFEGKARTDMPDIGAFEAEASAPEIVTVSLPDATENSEYLFAVDVADPDVNDRMTVELLEAPEWLEVSENNELTGIPSDSDTGADIPVTIRVVDSYSLADTLVTTLRVININNPPLILNTGLKNAKVFVAYYDSLKISDPDSGDILSYTLLEGPGWLTLSDTGILSGFPAINDEADSVLVKIAVSDSPGLADTLSTAIDVVYIQSVNARIILDGNLAEPGNQADDIIGNPGPEKYIGFTVYLRENVTMRSFRITLGWDSSQFVFKKIRSGPKVEEDEYTINGSETVLQEEESMMYLEGFSLSSIVEIEEPGRFREVFTKLGGTDVNVPEGLLFFAVFKTTADLNPLDKTAIDVLVELVDSAGEVVPLPAAVFRVGEPIVAPTGLEIVDSPEDQGHNLTLNWTASIDEELGIVDYYRIYRSTAPEIGEIAIIDSLYTLDDIIAWEEMNATLIDSVMAGEPSYSYNDIAVPKNGDVYYYWVDCVGSGGVSEKAALETATGVKQMRLPAAITMREPYPNPFNPSTTIEFAVPEAMPVTLSIYNVSGQRVQTLLSEKMAAGTHTVTWNGAAMPSGLYFVRLHAKDSALTKKLTLIK